MIDISEETEAFADAEERPSKSQLKRESAALQDLAAELAALPKVQLAALPLPENILAALLQAAAMPPRGARKRQLKYVGGLFREIDVSPILEGLARLKNQSADSTRELHKVERWRDRLIAEDDAALTELLSAYSSADRQHLRQLIRSAKKETEQGAAPKSARLLFRYLRDLFGAGEEG
jgi:ribosome-associated protein